MRLDTSFTDFVLKASRNPITPAQLEERSFNFQASQATAGDSGVDTVIRQVGERNFHDQAEIATLPEDSFRAQHQLNESQEASWAELQGSLPKQGLESAARLVKAVTGQIGFGTLFGAVVAEQEGAFAVNLHAMTEPWFRTPGSRDASGLLSGSNNVMKDHFKHDRTDEPLMESAPTAVLFVDTHDGVAYLEKLE